MTREQIGSSRSRRHRRRRPTRRSIAMQGRRRQQHRHRLYSTTRFCYARRGNAGGKEGGRDPPITPPAICGHGTEYNGRKKLARLRLVGRWVGKRHARCAPAMMMMRMMMIGILIWARSRLADIMTCAAPSRWRRSVGRSARSVLEFPPAVAPNQRLT